MVGVVGDEPSAHLFVSRAKHAAALRRISRSIFNSAFSLRSRASSARTSTHRRGGYRDPESQAFIESWFGQFKKRVAWRSEWESIDQARHDIATYVNTYHHRPHSGIAYQTPAEVAATWQNIKSGITD